MEYIIESTEYNNTNKNNLISKLIDFGCFKTGDFVLKSGRKTNYYIDFRHLISNPKLLKTVCSLIDNKIKKDINNNTVLCGLPYAGIPYATTLSVKNNIPQILLRKEQKKHGTKKMVEGIFNSNSELIIIDDILTSGQSIKESLVHFEKQNITIKKIVVILDRNEGGRDEIKRMGIDIDYIFGIDEFIKVKEMMNYRNSLYSRIKAIMTLKQSNLCVSIDFTKTSKILSCIETLKDNIVIAKIHCDIIDDFTKEFVDRISELCKTNNIFIFEDRKFSDIGSTFHKQFTGGIFRIRDWANITTFHGVVGDGIIEQFSKIKKQDQAGLIVAQMSNKNNLIDKSYTDKCVEIAKKYSNSILGFVSQEKLIKDEISSSKMFLYFTPGVSLISKNDNIDQQYITPQQAIKNGADIIIVGRGIIQSENMLEECKKYQKLAWNEYMNI